MSIEKPGPSQEEVGIKPEEMIIPEKKLSKEEKLFQEGQETKGAILDEIKKMFPDFGQRGGETESWSGLVKDAKHGADVFAHLSKDGSLSLTVGSGSFDRQNKNNDPVFINFRPDERISANSFVLNKLKPWECGRTDYLADPKREEVKIKQLRELYWKNPHVVVERLKNVLNVLKSMEVSERA